MTIRRLGLPQWHGQDARATEPPTGLPPTYRNQANLKRGQTNPPIQSSRTARRRSAGRRGEDRPSKLGPHGHTTYGKT